MKRTLALSGLTLLLLAMPASAQFIGSGIDIWRTPADASTRVDFHSDPIPADFFCKGSQPFYGTVALGGEPLVTSPEGALGAADTVIHRLDDMVFEQGVAETRIQVAALSLVSLTPLNTRCGAFDVRATLAGEQPITRMQVVDDGTGNGTYSAPLSLNVKLSFSPVGAGERVQALELLQRIDLEPAPGSRWTHSTADLGGLGRSHVMVDANGDGRAATLLPGLDGSFLPTSLGQTQNQKYNKRAQTPITICHVDPVGGHQHCIDDAICLEGGQLLFCTPEF